MRISIIDDERVNDSKGGVLSHVDDTCDLASLREFAEVATLVHIAPGIFKDNRKRQDHLEEIGFICFDFDDGRISSTDVHTQLKYKFNHVILGSKNCFKDKDDGKGVIERFHVFIPTDTPITSVDLYKFICRSVAKFNLWSVDNNCMEPSRYFYKHSCVLIEHNKAEPLDVDRYVKMKEIQDKIESMRKPMPDFIDCNSTPATEKFKRTKYYRMLEGGELKTDGERYQKSCSIIGAMKVNGLSQEEAMNLFDQYSTYGKSFTRESIVRRIRQWS